MFVYNESEVVYSPLIALSFSAKGEGELSRLNSSTQAKLSAVMFALTIL